MNDFFNKLSPKSALIVGLIGGVMVLCTIGFVILLGLYWRNSNSKNVIGVGNSVPVAGAQAPSAPNRPAAPVPSGSVPPLTKADHVRGSGSVTLVEYSDIECPYCKRFHPTMLQVMNEFKGKVKWVYRHYPLSFHANAQKEAEATECANELGGNDAFWKYLDALFERTTSNGNGFALDALVPLAKELGLNESKFKTCLDSGKYAQHIQDETNSGSAAGVSGTPGTFIIGKDGQAQLIPGALPFEQIKTAIDAALR